MKKIKYISIAIFILGFLLFRPYTMQSEGQLYGSDDKSYFAHATALVFFQFPFYENEYYEEGGKVPLHSIGPALMAFPFVFIFSQIDRLIGSSIVAKRDMGNILPSWSLFGFVISTFFYFWLACIVLFIGLRYYYDEWTAFLAIVFMALFQGMPLYVFRRPIFSCVYEFFLQSALIFIVLKDHKDNCIDTHYAITILIGVCTGLITLVRYNNIAISIAWPFVLFCIKESTVTMKDIFNNVKKNFNKIIVSYAIALLIIFIFKVIPLIVNGNEPYSGLLYSRLSHSCSLLAYLKRIFHIIFGIDWGLIFTAPFLVISLIVVFMMKDSIKNKLLFLMLPLLVNLNIVILFGSQGAWYGYRFLIFSLAPILIYPFAFFIDYAVHTYNFKRIVLLFSVVSIAPVMSMLAFEGNTTNLTLTLIEQGFGIKEWGNLSYQLEVWKTFFYSPLEFLIALSKGGPIYLVYIIMYCLNLTRLLPSIVLTKYPEFKFDILFKTCSIYLLPFIIHWIHKRFCKNNQ